MASAVDPERDVPVGDRQDQAPAPAQEPIRALHWWDRPLVAIDTETTGTDPLEARIVQIACLAVYPNGRVSPQSYQAIVNPGVPIPAEASAIHGIDDARAQAEGVPPQEALTQVLRRLQRWNRASPVVIYNVPFDWPLLWAELGRTSLAWTDPLADARLLDPLLVERTFNGVAAGNFHHSLAKVAYRYGIGARPVDPLRDPALTQKFAVPGFHEANSDAVAAVAILRCQVERYQPLRTLSLAALQRAQRDWFASWRDQLNAYWASRGKPQRVAGEWPFGERSPHEAP